jgi:hypothetical protein
MIPEVKKGLNWVWVRWSAAASRGRPSILQSHGIPALHDSSYFD